MCKLCISKPDELYLKDPKLDKGDVAALQEWMGKEAHLPKISDFQIICFLSNCYYSIEATKLCIENYYTIRCRCPEIFSGRNLKNESLNYHLDSFFLHPLPKRTKENYQIMYANFENFSVDKMNFLDMLRIMDVNLILANWLSGPQDGHVFVIDGANLQLGHILKMNVTWLSKFLFFMQEAMPIRMKAIHVLNVNAVVEKALNVARPFLKGELINQMHCHVNVEGAYRFVPKELLPAECGGNAGTVRQLREEWIEKVKDHADAFVKDEQLKSDDTKRSGTPKNLEDLFGTAGSFKKLDID